MTNEQSLVDAMRWLKNIQEVHSSPTVIVGNKCDKDGQIAVTDDEIKEIKTEAGIQVYKVSAMSGFNVDKAFFKTV